MSVKINKGNALDHLNLTPMIDCVFLLLIFFLVASEFDKEAKQERELPIRLPQASEAMPITAKPSELFVNVDREGRYIVQNQLLSEPQLHAALQQAATNNPGRQAVIIRADKSCQWEFVVVVMNLCNKVGIRDYLVTTLGADGAPHGP